MMIVRAKAAGLWKSVPYTPAREWEKTMVRVAHVQRDENTGDWPSWAVGHRGVRVFPGLIISFPEKEQADHFLGRPNQLEPKRAEPVIVETGHELVFESDADALYFIGQGIAEALTASLSYEDVMRLFQKMQEDAQAEAAAEAEIDSKDLSEPIGKRGRRKAKAA